MSLLKKLINKIRRALYHSSDMPAIVNQSLNQFSFDIEKKLRVVQLQNQSVLSNEKGITTEKYFDNELIVSLTTYGRRIYDVYLTIESLMQQTVKPNKIILWLAEDEFSLENIPVSLKKLQNRGLTIEFCEDIKSYKKLVPALRKYPNDIIITVDDDALYQSDLIENLLNSYRRNPGVIHFCRGHRMKFSESGELLPYNNWSWFVEDDTITHLNVATGLGGVLYPPCSLHNDVLDSNLFMKLCPMADDIWFKTMALRMGTKYKKAYTHNKKGTDYIPLDNEAQTETALFNINVTKNDEQIKAVFDTYDIYELLK